MSKAQAPITEDELFLAFTRPAMLWGVPVEALIVNGIVSAIIYMGGGSLIYLGVGPIIHLVFREICKRDHNQFKVLFVWLQTKGKCRNARLWGGSSVSPLKLARTYDEKEL